MTLHDALTEFAALEGSFRAYRLLDVINKMQPARRINFTGPQTICNDRAWKAHSESELATLMFAVALQ